MAFEFDWFESKLPPYGVMPESAVAGDAPPKDWRGGVRSFLERREQLLALLNKHLWPMCDADAGKWKGEAAKSMESLTLADLAILQAIREPGPSRLIDSLPDSPLRHLNCPAHVEFFDREDSADKKIRETLRSYDRLADASQSLDAMPVLFNRGLFEKLNLPLIFWFKSRLQRPRPNQSAIYLKRPLTHRPAQSGLHPSMISGHCLQGMGMLMAVAERLELDRIAISPDSWAALSQFFVDFGDRRVMAGAHFPSDNLASWIIALDFCEHTIDPSVQGIVKKRAADAIKNRSLIYREVEKANSKMGGSSPYRGALDELDRVIATA
jgi:hypothetical protein